MISQNSKIRIILLQPITVFTSSFDFKNTIVTHLLELATEVKHSFRNDSNVSIEVVNLIDENIFKPSSVSEMDKHIKSLEHFLQQYNTGQRLVFGISCFSSNYYISSLILAKLIREFYPKALICVGGYQVNYFTEEFIFPRTIEGTNVLIKLFDYVFLGECDYSFAAVLKERVSHNRLDSQESEPCHVIQSYLIKNLEDLPFIDYSLMKMPNSLDNSN